MSAEIWLLKTGEKITNLGFSLLPLSFVAYLLFRPIGYFFDVGYFKIVKAIWYLTSGIAMLVGDVRVETVVMFIAFIESYDLVFQYFEDKKDKNR